MISIAKRLDTILSEEIDLERDDPYQVAHELMAELDSARQKVAMLERQLVQATDRLCGSLALNVRKMKPGLNVGLGGGACKVGYRSKALNFKPDMTARMWLIDGPDKRFVRRFTRNYGPRTAMSNDFSGLARAIGEFFGTHYRSLGEEIQGDGIVLLNGRTVSLGTLAEHVEKLDAGLIG